MSSVSAEAIDRFLDDVGVRVEAFAICELGRHHRLNVEPPEEPLIHFVLRGEGFLDSGGQRLALVRGAVAVVPKGHAKSLCGSGPVERELDMSSSCPLEDGLIRFGAATGEADLVLGCAKLMLGGGSNGSLFDQLDHPIVMNPEHSLIPLFDMMLDELSEPRPGSKTFINALMMQVVIVLLRSESLAEVCRIPTQKDPRLVAVAAAILGNPEHRYTVESLARHAGMSRSRFNHHFTETYKCSPMEFVRSVRLSSAATLLRGSRLPVKAIAASVGYSSRSQFSHAFQLRYGVAPMRFRRQGRADIPLSWDERGRLLPSRI